MTKQAWLVVFTALLMACGPGGEASEGDGEDDTAGGEDDLGGTDGEPGDTVHASAIELIGISGPAMPWSEMSLEDREMDMVSRFHPIFRELFTNHDADNAEFDCQGCHGSDMQDRHFEMPNPRLDPVGAPGTPEYDSLRAEHPEMMRFMEEEVTPNMQTMLGMGTTFTCNGCHPTP